MRPQMSRVRPAAEAGLMLLTEANALYMRPVLVRIFVARNVKADAELNSDNKRISRADDSPFPCLDRSIAPPCRSQEGLSPSGPSILPQLRNAVTAPSFRLGLKLVTVGRHLPVPNSRYHCADEPPCLVYRLRLHQDMARQVVVVEHAANPEKDGARVISYPRHLTHTLDSNFLGGLVRRRDQDLNSDVCSDRRTPAAQNQRAVQRDVRGEAAFGVLHPVVPMEDNGQPQFVSHGSSALEDWTWGHGRRQNRQVPASQQDAERWEVYESTEGSA